jgi:hypothetical protein
VQNSDTNVWVGVSLALVLGALPMLEVCGFLVPLEKHSQHWCGEKMVFAERGIWLNTWTSSRIRTLLVLLITRKLIRKRTPGCCCCFYLPFKVIKHRVTFTPCTISLWGGEVGVNVVPHETQTNTPHQRLSLSNELWSFVVEVWALNETHQSFLLKESTRLYLNTFGRGEHQSYFLQQTNARSTLRPNGCLVGHVQKQV